MRGILVLLARTVQLGQVNYRHLRRARAERRIQSCRQHQPGYRRNCRGIAYAEVVWTPHDALQKIELGVYVQHRCYVSTQMTIILAGTVLTCVLA